MLNENIVKRLELAFTKIAKYCRNIDEIIAEKNYLANLLINALISINYNGEEIPGHELEHSFRVFELSIIMGCNLGADLRTLAISALLHDVGRFSRVNKVNHAEISANIARELLKEDKDRDLIVRAIREHSYSTSNKPSSLESAILQDADKLDALGFIGVARVFAYGGYMKRVIYTSIYNHDKKSSLQHFYDKILKLPSLMNTEVGRKIAEKRVEKIKLFIRELEKEINLFDVSQTLT